MGTGAHKAWGDVYEREWDRDTGSWSIPEKSKTPGYQGSHRKPRQPGRITRMRRRVAAWVLLR